MTEEQGAGRPAPRPRRPQHFEAPEPTAPHNPAAFGRWLSGQFEGLGFAPPPGAPVEGMGRNGIATDRRLFKFVSFPFSVQKGSIYDTYNQGRRRYQSNPFTRHELLSYVLERSGIKYKNRKQATNAIAALISRGAIVKAKL